MRWLLTFILCFTLPAHAYFQEDLLKAKRLNKQIDQWTLFDWLQEKKKIALQDQWLAMHHTSNWFELNLSGGGEQFDEKTTVAGVATTHNETAQHYGVDSYISLFNLNGDYQLSKDKIENFGGAAGLRLLGANSQTTSLVLRYGWRRRTDQVAPEHWDNFYAEGELQLYLLEPLGLSGDYRYYIPGNSSLGDRLEGSRLIAGVFFEFWLVRFFGNYYQESLKITSSGMSVTQTLNEGYEAGVRLFF